MSVEQLLAQKKLYERDRQTQLLSEKQTQKFNRIFDGGENQKLFERWLSQVAFHISRDLQMIDHHKIPFDWYVYRKLPDSFFKIPPWIIYQNESVHTYTCVGFWVGGPWAMHDELNHQYGPMTCHMARMTNSSYNLTIMIDIAHTVSYQPKESIIQDEKNEEENGGAPTPSSKKRKRKTKNKKEKRPIPPEWVDWPIRVREYIPRIPVFQLPLLCMSRHDPRCNGNGPCDAFLYTSPSDHGGNWLQEGSVLSLPDPEGMRHNNAFVLASNKISENMGKTNWKYADENETVSEREQAAILGFLHHMNEMSTVHIRCMHPRGTNKSTHTWNLKMTKFNKYEIYSGNVLSAAYQFWDGKCEPTIFFLAGGIPLNRIIPFIKYVGQEDWYDAAFRIILNRMISRHPNYVQTQEDALIYISDVTHATPGFSFNIKKTQTVQKPQQNQNQTNNNSPSAYVNWTKQKKIQEAEKLLSKGWFPQIGTSPAYLLQKTFFMAYCIHILLLKMCARRPYDLKDAYDNQRYDTNGILLSNLNRRCLFRFMSRVDQDLRNFIKDQIQIHWSSVFNDAWTNEVTAAYISGHWSPDKKSPGMPMSYL
jgi:hypothetical protein